MDGGLGEKYKKGERGGGLTNRYKMGRWGSNHFQVPSPMPF